MRLQNLSIGKKIGVTIGIVLSLLIINSSFTYISLQKIDTSITEVRNDEKLDENFLHILIKHHQWVENVSNSILSGNNTALTASTNDHTCALGTWLYSEKRKKIELKFPELASLFNQLETPHRVLHNSAAKIKKATPEEASTIFQEETLPKLKQVEKIFEEINHTIESTANGFFDDLQKKMQSEVRLTLILGIIALLLGSIIAIIMTRNITKPINQAVTFANKMAEGDFSQRLTLVQRDETGKLTDSLNAMADNVGNMVGEINSEMQKLARSSTQLNSISGVMLEGTTQTSKRTDSVAAATEKMSTNMSSVAAASEEAATSVNIVATAIEEILQSVQEETEKTNEARTITQDAVGLVRSSSEKVDALGSAANEISKVTEVITEISEQTNLLALNATIEAARAGEAGKGFAVVANEIKELAKQTAAATGEIKSKIESIQGSTNETVAEIKQINEVISKVDDIVTEISAAVEEQNQTSSEISTNVTHAAQGIAEVNENMAQSSTAASEIAENITGVSEVAGNLSISGKDIRKNAEELSGMVDTLKTHLAKFKIAA